MSECVKLVDLKREKDPETLREIASLALQEIERLSQQIRELLTELNEAKGGDRAQLELRLQELQSQLERRNRMLFGKSSEKRKPATRKKKGKGQGHQGRTPQPKLEEAEPELHELDEADKVCPTCGEGLSEWEGKRDSCELIHYEPPRFFLVRHEMQKYVCKNGCCVETAPGPVKLMPGTRYSIAFVIGVVIGKYADHLPLERQVRMMKRQGLDVTSQTLWDQSNALTRVLESADAAEALRAEVFSSGVVAADETRWPILHHPKAAAWHMWAATDGKTVFYQIHDSRSERAGRALLDGYQGTLVCDGYTVYEKLGASPNITLSLCWSHARREYVTIAEAFPEETEQILELIGELYGIEKRARLAAEDEAGDEPPSEELRLRKLREARDSESRKVIARIKQWMIDVETLPGSGLAKAINYIANRWTALTRFLDDPRIPLDSNIVERALRGPVLGRKNHYGSRSVRGTEVAALMYSLIESAKLAGVEPQQYLETAVARVLAGDPFVTPRQYAAELAAAELTAAE
jgi:transposase